MHIVAVHNYYLQPGGEDKVFTSETELLRLHGNRVTQYTVSNDRADGHSNLTLARWALWNGEHRAALQDLLSRERPDLVHVHNTLPLLSPSVYYAARAATVPVIQTMHNYRPFCLNGVLYRDGQICEECIRKIPVPGVLHKCYRQSAASSAVVLGIYLAHYRLLRTYQRLIETFIASTEFEKRLLIRMGVAGEKITVKPNPVIPAADPILPNQEGTNTGPYFAYVGRLDQRKGLWTLLSAVEATGLPLILIGDGVLRSEIEDWIAQRRDMKVMLTGWLDDRRVQGYISRSLALVLPSEFYESFGNVIVEAFAQGVPVVTTEIGAQAELVEKDKTGLLFPPHDSDALARRLTTLAEDRALRKRLGDEAKRVYDAKYSADVNYARLIEIYQAALSGKGA